MNPSDGRSNRDPDAFLDELLRDSSFRVFSTYQRCDDVLQAANDSGGSLEIDLVQRVFRRVVMGVTVLGAVVVPEDVPRSQQ